MSRGEMKRTVTVTHPIVFNNLEYFLQSKPEIKPSHRKETIQAGIYAGNLWIEDLINFESAYQICIRDNKFFNTSFQS